MKMCPLTGDPCMKHDCEWYIQVMGMHPQTGEAMNKWGCSISFMPMLLIENSMQQNQTGAAIESFRNEVVVGNAKMFELFDNAKRLNGG